MLTTPFCLATSRSGATTISFSFFSCTYFITSRNPTTYLRLANAFTGSRWYSRSWNFTMSFRSSFTALSRGTVTELSQYLHVQTNIYHFIIIVTLENRECMMHCHMNEENSVQHIHIYITLSLSLSLSPANERTNERTNERMHRVSQEECDRLWEGVPYVKVYRYNPKHICPKLNGYGDNGQRKVWSSGGSTHCPCQLTA